MKKTGLFFIVFYYVSAIINAQVRLDSHQPQYADNSERIPKDKIITDCRFFAADSLTGFPLEAEIDKALKTKHHYSELKATIHQKEKAFVYEKYHISNPVGLTTERNSIHPNTPLSAGCSNIGFDDNNDFTGWTGYYGHNVNSNMPLTLRSAALASPTFAINPTQYACDYFSLVKTGTDPLVGFSLVSPLGGYAAKLGGEARNVGGAWYCDTASAGSGSNTAGEVLERSFLVTTSNTEFQYCFAFVYYDDGSHTNGEQPYFKVEVLDSNGDTITCLNYYQQGNHGVAPKGYDSVVTKAPQYVYNKVYYTNGYKTSSLNLKPYLTHTVTVRFTVAGCNQTAHFGYAYVDCACAPLALIIPSFACIGGKATLDAPIQDGGTYVWSGLGIVSGAGTPTVSVNQSGTYSVTITERPGCSYMLDTTVTFYPNPIVMVNSATICPGATATLTAASTGAGILNYAWTPSAGFTFTNPQDSSGITKPAVTTTYAVTGTSAYGCTNTAVSAITVSPGTPPSFSVAPVCLGATSSFVNTTGGINTYTWTFGDGTPTVSNLQNPTYTYATAGTFSVTLTAAMAGGCTGSVTGNAVVDPSLPLNFTADHPCNGTATNLTNNTQNQVAINAWSWDFGDGSAVSTSLTPPAHMYPSAGCYSVVLTATTSAGCKGIYDTTVYVYANPIAAFTASTICVGSPSGFTDGSSVTNPPCLNEQVNSWNWNFGDGQTAQNTTSPGTFTHAYASCGAYNITLTVSTGNGCTNTFTLTNDTVYCLPVVTAPASFSVCPNTNVPGQLFTTVVSSGGPAYCNWVAASNNSGMSSTTGQDSVLAYTSIAQNPGCNNLTDIITAQAVSKAGCIGNKASYAVTIYPTPALTPMNNDTICANASLTLPDFTACPASSSISWTNNNSTNGLAATGTGNLGTFTGLNTISPLALNVAEIDAVPTANGCPGPVSSFTIVIKPIPQVTASSTTVCPTSQVNISLYTSPAGTSVSWTNNNTAIGLVASGNGQPTPYPAPTNTTLGSIQGNITYVPILDGCAGLSYQDTIVIKPEPFMQHIPNQYLCPGYSITPVNFAILPPTNSQAVLYNWSYTGGGALPTTGTGAIFSIPGTLANTGQTTLNTQVTVYPTLNGCQGPDSTFNISVYPNPVPGFSFTAGCLGQFSSFTDLSTCGNNIPITQWNWNFNNGQGQSIIQNPNYTFATSGTQTVSLTVVSNPSPLPLTGGCIATTTGMPVVYPIPAADFIGDSLKSCPQLSTQFTSQSTVNSGSVTSYTWTFGNGQTSNQAIPPRQNYTNASSTQSAYYTVSLIVASDEGCVSPKTTKTNYIQVYPKPIAGFSWGPSGADIDDPRINFVNESKGASEYLPSKTYGPDGIQYDLGDVFAAIPSQNAVYTNQNFFHVYEHYDPYTYYVTQWVINSYGCTDEITKPIEILPDFTFYIPNAFSPNGDGTNDGFKGTGVGIDLTTYNLWIFDRWGLQIFYSDDLEKTWDGHMHDVEDHAVLQQDVYVWKVKFNDIISGKKHEFHGTVTLLK